MSYETSLQHHSFRTFDGTTIRYISAGPANGPVLMLANGLGGNVTCWEHLIRHFSNTHRLICWDYRGLYTSDPAINDRYTIQDHARDLECLLAHENIVSPTLVGWSMGVQVNLEYVRRNPGAAAGLILLNGTPGRPYRTAFDRNLDRPMTVAWNQIGRHWKKVMRFRRVFTRGPIVNGFASAAVRAGLAAESLDRHMFRELGLRWVTLDLGIYGRIFNRLAEHDATDMLDTVDVPVLVVGGAADKMTPLHRSELMAHRIPGAELFVLAKGTHFSPIEYPDLINMRMRKFLRQRVECAKLRLVALRAQSQAG